ncbi:MAG: hypothetical protein M1833_002713 [Piccolia ochrophora]|nr:MAG: hypothetical protein M1833_002713 [Piccolia ochrophora]
MPYDDNESALFSSPDPLAQSPASRFPVSVITTRRKSQVASTAPSTRPRSNQTPERFVQTQEFVLNTPQRTPKSFRASPEKPNALLDNVASPWRIRVTVEAEAQDEDEDLYAIANTTDTTGSPVKKRGTRTKDTPLKHGTKTTTTTIPVKGLESSPQQPAKRRGRPRKSDISPVKRAATPAQQRRRRRRTTGDGFETDRSEAEVVVTPKRGRGRPRKKPAESAEDSGDIWANLAEDHTSPGLGLYVADASAPKPDLIRKKSRGRRKAISPVHVAIDSEEAELTDTGTKNAAFGVSQTAEGPLREIEVNSATSASTVTSNVFEAAMSGACLDGPVNVLEDACNEPSPAFHKITPKKKTPNKGVRDTYAEDPVSLESQPTPAAVTNPNPHRSMRSTAAADSTEVPARENKQGTTSNHLTGEYQDADSVLESEGFSMVSISSLPSAREHLGNLSGLDHSCQKEGGSAHAGTEDASLGAFSTGDTPNVDRHEPPLSSIQETKSSVPPATWKNKSSPPSVGDQPSRTGDDLGKLRNISRVLFGPNQRSGDGESSTVHNMQSSPPSLLEGHTQPSHLAQQVTPSMLFSSPSLPPLLPPPPKAEASFGPPSPRDTAGSNKEKTPKLARVANAGSALQGALGAIARLRSPFKSPAKQKKTSDADQSGSVDDLFGGFSAGTRRELRAGLKLGEELARRQVGRLETGKKVMVPLTGSGDDVFAPRDQVRESSDESQPLMLRKRHAHDASSSKTVHYPQLPSPVSTRSPAPMDNEDAMSWRADTPLKVYETSVQYSSEAQSSPVCEAEITKSAPFENTIERHARWARERKAISEEIEKATPSRVIILDDSDDSSSDNSNLLEELSFEEEVPHIKIEPGLGHFDGATMGQSTVQDVDTEENSPPIEEAVDHDAVANIGPAPMLVKPPRGKIPSPWRANRQIIYSDELTEEDASRYSRRSSFQPQQTQRLAQPVKKAETREPLEIDDEDEEDDTQREPSPHPKAERSMLDLSGLLGLKSFAPAIPWMKPNKTPRMSSDPVPPESPQHTTPPPTKASVVSPCPVVPTPASPLRATSSTNPTTVTVTAPSPKAPSPKPATKDPKTDLTTSPTRTWRKPHWRVLDKLIASHPTSSLSPIIPSGSASNVAATPNLPLRPDTLKATQLYGTRVRTKIGASIIMGPVECAVVQDFRARVSEENDGWEGWSEGVVARRLAAVRVGDVLRKEDRERERQTVWR